MKGTKKDLVNYRLLRAKDALDDAQILAERNKWNSTINRLYYSAYYAVMALLLDSDLNPTTHNGAKSNFSEHFILTNKYQRNTVRFIHNCLLGDKRGIMMICLISTRTKFCHISNLFMN